MKTITFRFVFFFVLSFCNAQEAKFKNKDFEKYFFDNGLGYVTCYDANGNAIVLDSDKDKKVLQSELDVVEKINFDNYPLADFDDLSFFTNVKSVKLKWDSSVENNSDLYPVFDFNGNVKLEELVVNSDHIGGVHVEKCPNLKSLYINGQNSSADFDFSENEKLQILHIQLEANKQMRKVNLTRNVNIELLELMGLKLEAIDLSQNVNLGKLYLNYNDLQELDLSKQIRLFHLDCSNNRLKVIDLSQLNDLRYLDAHGNNLMNIILPIKNSVEYLLIHGNSELKTMDFTGFNRLKGINCDHQMVSFASSFKKDLKIVSKYAEDVFFIKNDIPKLDEVKKEVLKKVILEVLTLIKNEQYGKINSYYLTPAETKQIFNNYHLSLKDKLPFNDYKTSYVADTDRLKRYRKAFQTFFSEPVWNPMVIDQNFNDELNCLSNGLFINDRYLKKDYRILNVNIKVANNENKVEFDSLDFIETDNGWKLFTAFSKY
ncbi:hypothetical protein [Flavobacterium sp. GCM10023249]|uniref:hypothetical protein n=1 Tax=unclassified Flavobacterium TaxID=196869 RepID=UPI0036174775